MKRLILVLGDQLNETVAALREGDPERDVVVMAEVAAETTYVKHHPKKIALVLAAMRNFADHLCEAGWQVAYSKLDDPDNTGTIVGELLRRAETFGTTHVIATEPGEWRLIDALHEAPLDIDILEDTRFVATHAEFNTWAEGRKSLRMEYFYREMRRKTGLLMEGDAPAGGKWNFDHDNRKPAREALTHGGPLRVELDDNTREVLELVETQFQDHFGDLRPFWFGTTRRDALRAFDDFIANALPNFGTYQDAMLTESRFLYHAVISAYLNIGLLRPMEVCRAVEAAWRAGQVPINSAEGFIRQIIGWREYVRGIYFLEGPGYATRNALSHGRALPPLYWGAPTRMACMATTVSQTQEDAYAHHIQRLMVTGNFALLAGIDPAYVHDWYLSVYADAFEWVEAPNTVGMSQFADGGIIASKPYVSSGAYINRMSDYCSHCPYNVKAKTGEDACPFNLLYWHFLNRHRDRFSSNHRMGNMYRTWDRMDADHRSQVLSDAEAFLARLDAGVPV